MQCSSNDSDFGSMAIVHTSPECSTIGNGKSMENPPLIDDVALKTLHVLREFKGICPLPPSTQLPKDPLTATGRAAPRNLSEFAGGSKGKASGRWTKMGTVPLKDWARGNQNIQISFSWCKKRIFYDLNMLHTGIQRFNEQKRKRPSCHLPRLAGNSLRIGIGT